MAKAPIAGQVKTRLGGVVGHAGAARLAAAALLDTLAACGEAFGPDRCHLALAGDLSRAVSAPDLVAALRGWRVHPQRGDGFAQRLAHAHADVAAVTGSPVVQVGMDTPHATAADLLATAALLGPATDAVLGPAEDGGWWVLALADPDLATVLAGVEMSTAQTGRDTHEALVTAGGRVAGGALLRDVDSVQDAVRVADAAPGTRFAAAWRELTVADPGACRRGSNTCSG